MSAAKEMSLIYFDVVEVSESRAGETPFRTRTGSVFKFPKSEIQDRTGHASIVEIKITEGDDAGLTMEYALDTVFPVRIDDYGRLIARVPKRATMDSGMNDVSFTRISRPLIQK